MALSHESLRQGRFASLGGVHVRLGVDGVRGGALISILAFGFGFVLGMLTGQGKLNWVRGVAGKARDVFFGARPARQPDIQPDISRGVMAHKQPTNPDNGPHTDHYATGQNAGQNRGQIDFVRAARNILAFFAGLIAWCARNPIVAIGLVVLALWLVFGLPFGFGKSKGQLRLEAEIAAREAQMQETLRERDEAIAQIRADTARTLEQIRLQSQRGHDAIAAATPEHEEPLDPGLVAAWRDALDGLCVPRANGDRADSCGP